MLTFQHITLLFDVIAFGSQKGNLLRESLLLTVADEEWMMRKIMKSPSEKIVKIIKLATRKQ